MDSLEHLETLQENWSMIEKILPVGWEKKAKECKAWGGAYVQKFLSPSILLRVLLMHITGSSLRQTAVQAKVGDLVDVSDVAILKRLRKCQAWFCWMVQKLASEIGQIGDIPALPGKRVRLIDGSVISEPGAKGSTWRLHYAINASTLCCDEAHVTDIHQGESLTHFAIEPNDVLMGDRNFASRRGIRYVKAQQGDVIVRMNLTNVPLEDEQGTKVEVLSLLRSLKEEEVGIWKVWMRDEQGTLPLRLCVRKHNAQQGQEAQDRVRKDAKKDKHTLQPQTLEAACYVMVLTTLLGLPAEVMLGLYRWRWQIELAFKRLKSLLGYGHLKKKDEQGAQAWLQGKLLLALLIEKLIATGVLFSPERRRFSDQESLIRSQSLA
jgi:hypothetical protein